MLKNVKKIRKNEARKLFYEGAQFWIVPCKLRPEFGLLINCAPYDAEDFDNNFDRLISNFTYYNCDYERGYYPAFYTDEP